MMPPEKLDEIAARADEVLVEPQRWCKKLCPQCGKNCIRMDRGHEVHRHWEVHEWEVVE